MNLLIDFGNSRLKWATAHGNTIAAMAVITHANQPIGKELQAVWQKLETPRYVALSSVSSETLVNEISALVKKLWPTVEMIRATTEARAYGVSNAYRDAAKLGVDRWLCLLAAYHYHSAPVCIVDCGTAVTVDVMDASGKHQGGVISPGLKLMKKSLQRGTQHLQYTEKKYAAGLASDTQAAIYNGTLFSVIGLIKYVMARQPENTALILTGGDAELIGSSLSLPFLMEPDLVLQGLNVLLENR